MRNDKPKIELRRARHFQTLHLGMQASFGVKAACLGISEVSA